MAGAFAPLLVPFGAAVLLASALPGRSFPLAPAVAVSAPAAITLLGLLSPGGLLFRWLPALPCSTPVPGLSLLTALLSPSFRLTALILGPLLLAALPSFRLTTLVRRLLPLTTLLLLLGSLTPSAALLLSPLLAGFLPPPCPALLPLRSVALLSLRLVALFLTPLPARPVSASFLSVLLLGLSGAFALAAPLLRSVPARLSLFSPSPLSVPSVGRLSSTHRYQPVWALSRKAGGRIVTTRFRRTVPGLPGSHVVDTRANCPYSAVIESTNEFSGRRRDARHSAIWTVYRE